MWNSTENDVVCNKVSYDSVRIEVRRPVQNDNIKIAPLVVVPNTRIPAEDSKYGSKKKNIDRPEKNTMSYITDNDTREVQKNEVVQNTVDENYKEQIKKNWEWIKTVSSLINSIKDKNEALEKKILSDIMTRWLAIHDNHVGNLVKQGERLTSESVVKKSNLFVYGEQSSLLDKNKELSDSNSSFEDFLTTIFEEKLHNTNETKIDRNSLSNTDDRTNNYKVIKNSPSFSKKPINKRKKSSGKKSPVDSKKNHKIKKLSNEEDEDLEFFYSIYPTVQSLTSDQKSDFRIQTMQLLYDIIYNISSINRSIENSPNTLSPLYTTPDNSFQPLTCTSEIDIVWSSPDTPSVASYYSEFSPDEL
uniref:BESS domain-containing protein n=1 Tax=Schizaphis graminum TaxID=13262 RepID=A0A2S2NVJ2_SCHGA